MVIKKCVFKHQAAHVVCLAKYFKILLVFSSADCDKDAWIAKPYLLDKIP